MGDLAMHGAHGGPDPGSGAASDASWRSAGLHAAPVVAFVLGAFYYAFAVADRSSIFLYGHLDATPFDEVTSGRYWMVGLVASGAVLVGYTAANWLLGRAIVTDRSARTAPAWWRAWALCVLPLGVGIPAVTMNVNSPRLPASSAAACAAAALGGLAIALWLGSLAARQPGELLWLLADGAGLMPPLLLLRAVELPGRGLRIESGTAYAIAAGSVLASVVWLALMTGLRALRRSRAPGAMEVLVAGLALSYLLMPLAHHVLSTPPDYRYVSASTNFFAFAPGTQAIVLLVAMALTFGATHARRSILSGAAGSSHAGSLAARSGKG